MLRLNAIKKVKQSHYRPGQAQISRRWRFQDSRHMKVVRLSALRTDHLYPHLLISFRG